MCCAFKLVCVCASQMESDVCVCARVGVVSVKKLCVKSCDEWCAKELYLTNKICAFKLVYKSVVC